MLYDYECQTCAYNMIDVYQSIHEEALINCPNCGNDSLQRVIHGGVGCFVKDIKTIGQLADKNWSTLGTYKKSEIESQQNTKTNKEQSIFSSAGNATRKEINKMTPEQKTKYIMEGKK
jgi:putative FmdB family regulatory protein